MKRKLIIAGVFLGFILAAVVVVLVTRQDISQPSAHNTIDLTPGKQIVLQPQGGYARMSVVSDLPKSNAAPAAAAQK